MFSKMLESVDLITEGIDSQDKYLSKIKLVEKGYSPHIIEGSLRGQKNEKTGEMMYVYDIEYTCKQGIRDTIRRTESFGMSI
jgi:hypothetical protein